MILRIYVQPFGKKQPFRKRLGQNSTWTNYAYAYTTFWKKVGPKISCKVVYAYAQLFLVEFWSNLFLHRLYFLVQPFSKRLFLYFLMTLVLRQNPVVAENRSILLAAVVLIYMILFGHGLPMSINKNLF
jgi:hypothetical protein